MFLPFAVFGLNPELLIVLVVVLLLFGNRLPGVMRSLGGVTEFKKGIEGIEDDLSGSVHHNEPPKQVDDQSVKKAEGPTA